MNNEDSVITERERESESENYHTTTKCGMQIQEPVNKITVSH